MRKINPVYLRGLKSRMRGVRAPIMISIYLAIVLAVFALVYMSMNDISMYGGVSRPAMMGSFMTDSFYPMLSVILFAVIAMMVPAMNAGTIAAEREKQTLDLLLCSPLSASSIIMGKLSSNLTFVMFLLVLVMPFFAIIYLFGALSIANVLMLMLFLLISAYACASVATFFSCLVKKTSVATILSYATLLLFVIITLVIGTIQYTNHFAQSYMSAVTPEEYFPVVWLCNPIIGLVELSGEAMGSSTSDAMMYGGSMYGSSFSLIGMLGLGMDTSKAYSYLYSSGLMIVVSIILNINSARLIKPVNKWSIFK